MYWPVDHELINLTHWKCLTEFRMFWSLISRIVSRWSKLTNRNYLIQNVMAFLVTTLKFVKTWKNTLLCDSMLFFPFFSDLLQGNLLQLAQHCWIFESTFSSMCCSVGQWVVLIYKCVSDLYVSIIQPKETIFFNILKKKQRRRYIK